MIKQPLVTKDTKHVSSIILHTSYSKQIEKLGINIISDFSLRIAWDKLKNYSYIDKRQEHKREISNQQTLEALEKMFAPAKELSNNYLNYY